MPKKQKEIPQDQPIQAEQPQLNPHEILRLIEKQECIHLAIASLSQGKPWAITRFPGYSGYLTRLRLAYDQEKPVWFLELLTAYFADAYKHVPHMPVPQRAVKACEQIGELIEKYGVRQVGRCILARMLN